MPTQDIYAVNGEEQKMNGVYLSFGGKVPYESTLGEALSVVNVADVSGLYQTRFDDVDYYKQSE